MQIKDFLDFNKAVRAIENNARKNPAITYLWSGPALGRSVVPIWIGNTSGTVGMWFTEAKLTLHDFAKKTIPYQLFDMPNIEDLLPTENYIRITFKNPVTFKCNGTVFENIKAIKIDLADFAQSIGYIEEN